MVLVDETFLTRRKHNRGGFQGRITKGHTTVIFAAMEMSVMADGSHKETGRAVLKVVPNKETETLAKIMKRYIKPGSDPEHFAFCDFFAFSKVKKSSYKLRLW